jgi:hypothetical protein
MFYPFSNNSKSKQNLEKKFKTKFVELFKGYNFGVLSFQSFSEKCGAILKISKFQI